MDLSHNVNSAQKKLFLDNQDRLVSNQRLYDNKIVIKLTLERMIILELKKNQI